jgi:hypothetical protein
LFGNNGAKENDTNSGNVYSKLELQEFSNNRQHITTPTNGLYDGGEVVIKKHDIASVHGDLSAANSHGKTNISFFQSRSIIGSLKRLSYIT